MGGGGALIDFRRYTLPRFLRVFKTFSLLFGSPANPLLPRYTNKSLFDIHDSFSRYVLRFQVLFKNIQWFNDDTDFALD